MNIELPRRELDLCSAIRDADIRCLLMVLVHMTGDECWLQPPYKPKRDVRLIPDPDAGVPAAIQDEVRAARRNGVRGNGRQRGCEDAIKAPAPGPEDGENQEQQKQMETMPSHTGNKAFLQIS